MARRQEVLADLARQIVRLPPDRIIRVAIDGVDGGAGKTTLANERADAIRAIRARPYSPEGYTPPSSNISRTRQALAVAGVIGSSIDPAALANRRYVEGQRVYLRACKPKATIVNNDLSRPTLIAKR